MRRSKIVSVGELWNDYISDPANESILRRLKEARIPQIWEDLVGKAAADTTGSIYLRNGILSVHVTSSVIRYELFMCRESLRTRINAELGAEIVRTLIIK